MVYGKSSRRSEKFAFQLSVQIDEFLGVSSRESAGTGGYAIHLTGKRIRLLEGVGAVSHLSNTDEFFVLQILPLTFAESR
jgi:hypothetical protein